MTGRLSLIVAHDLDGLIGRDGDLPWRLPKDLQYFKRLTLGNTVLMGRRTWDSLPRKPLPERDNWVLSRDPGFAPEGAQVFADLDVALHAPCTGERLVIGGAELYRQALPRAQRLYLTLVQARVPGDTYFPPYRREDWRLLAREDHPADERHAHAYSFLTLERADATAGAY